jgi:hypothetical protein
MSVGWEEEKRREVGIEDEGFNDLCPLIWMQTHEALRQHHD